MFAHAEGVRGGVHAGVDEVPQFVFRQAAVVLDEGGEAVLGGAEGKREESGS